MTPPTETSIAGGSLERNERRVSALYQQLQHPRIEIRLKAVRELATCGDDALPLLRQVFATDYPDVCIAAIQSLERIETPAADVALLTDALTHREQKVRLRAVSALKHLRGEDATTALSSALAHQDRATRLEAIGVIEKRRSPDAVQTLCSALTHWDGHTRSAAARALGRLGDRRAVPHLLEAQRRWLLGRSAGRQRRLRLCALLIFSALLAGGMWTMVSRRTGIPFETTFLAVYGAIILVVMRRFQGEQSLAVSEALAQIAEKSPSPEIHAAVPELRTVARDGLQYSADSRKAALAAASRIEELTGRLQQSPIASGPGPSTVAGHLPLPATPPQEEECRC